MKMILLIVVFLSLPLASGVLAQASSEVYVSITGDDANDGSISRPFRTIQRASDALTNGGMCYIREGVYRETVTVSHGNQTFVNYPNENVIVTGLDEVNDWALGDDNVYRANFSGFETQFTQVFMDGVYQQMARYPNQTTGDMLDTSLASGYEDIDVFNGTGEATRRVHFPNMPALADNYWQGGYFRGISGHTWQNPHGVIASSSGTDLQVTPGLREWQRNNQNVDGSGWGFIFHLNALDAVGEWYAQDGNLYIKLPENTNPDDVVVEAQMREWAFRINGVNGTTIRGLKIKAASLEINASDSRVEETSLRYIYPYFTRPGYNAVFRDLGGIYVRGDNNIFKNCYVAHAWGNGFSIERGNGNRVENCIIEDIGWNAQFTSSILTHAANTTITNNTMGPTGRFHIRFRNKTDILYNDIYDAMKLGQDAGAIEATSGGAFATVLNIGGSEIAYNHIHDSTTLPTDSGRKQYVVAFYLEDVENYTVHHNVVWNFKTDVLPDGTFVYLGPRRTTIRDVYYYNNTVWDCDYRIRAWNRDGMGDIQNTFFANNLYDSSMLDRERTNTLLALIQHSSEIKSSSPTDFFQDYAGTNFQLKSGAAAIDAGEIIPGITDGYVGSAPDIGAYEYGQAPWVPGSTLAKPCFEDEGEVCDSTPTPTPTPTPTSEPTPMPTSEPTPIATTRPTPGTGSGGGSLSGGLLMVLLGMYFFRGHLNTRRYSTFTPRRTSSGACCF